MSLNDFSRKHELKNKATSNIKIYQFRPSIGLDIIDIYIRDGLFFSDIGIVKLHPSKGSHSIVYIKEVF